MDKQLIKNKLNNLVGGYKVLFPQEYKAVVECFEQNRRLQENEFASLKQDNGVVNRALYEIPETLNASIFKELSGEQLEYFKSKECARWFVRTFPEFSLATKI